MGKKKENKNSTQRKRRTQAGLPVPGSDRPAGPDNNAKSNIGLGLNGKPIGPTAKGGNK